MGIIPAKAIKGLVCVDLRGDGQYVEVPNCQIIGEGMGDSVGFLIVYEKYKYYLPKISEDLSSLIDCIIHLGRNIANNIYSSNIGGRITKEDLGIKVQYVTNALEDLKKNLV